MNMQTFQCRPIGNLMFNLYATPTWSNRLGGLCYLVEFLDGGKAEVSLDSFNRRYELNPQELKEVTLKVRHILTGRMAIAKRCWVDVEIEPGSSHKVKFPGYSISFDKVEIKFDTFVNVDDVNFSRSFEIVDTISAKTTEPFTDLEIQVLKVVNCQSWFLYDSSQFVEEMNFLIFAGILVYSDTLKCYFTDYGRDLYKKVASRPCHTVRLVGPQEFAGKKCEKYVFDSVTDECLFRYEGNLVAKVTVGGFNLAPMSDTQLELLGFNSRHPELPKIKEELDKQREAWRLLQLAINKGG